MRKRLLAKQLLFVVTYLLLLGYCFIFNNEAGWSLYFFLTLLFVVDLIFILPSLRKIQVTLDESVQTPKLKTTSLPLQMFNYRPTILPIPKLTLTFDEQKHHFSLYRGEPKRLDVNWTPTSRGIYSELPLVLESQELWGLFAKRRTLSLQQNLLVLPENKPEVVALIGLLKQQLQKNPYGESNFILRNYRTYQPGDSLKNIDWKLSSKQQELIYREHETEQQQELALLFWGESHIYFEETLDIFFSLQNLLLKQMTFQRLLIGENIDSPYQINATAFASIQPFADAPKQLPKLTNRQIIVITPDYSQALESYVAKLMRNNRVQVYTYQELMQQMSETSEVSE
jgi:hypothetical protein